MHFIIPLDPVKNFKTQPPHTYQKHADILTRFDGGPCHTKLSNRPVPYPGLKNGHVTGMDAGILHGTSGIY